MIRSSKHSVKFANGGKQELLSMFVNCYKDALEFYVSYLWNSRIEHDGYLLDDSNAAKNILNRHLLVEIPFGFRSMKKNLEGFFWNSIGLISKTGEEITVPQFTKT